MAIHKINLKNFRVLFFFAFLVLTLGRVEAARWTLLSFTYDVSGVHPQFGTQFPDWNQFIFDPVNTQFMNPLNGAGACGVMEKLGAPSNTAFFGLRGTTPIHLSKGQRIILTFYNGVAPTISANARVSFTDTDSALTHDDGKGGGSQPGAYWFTAYPEGSGSRVGTGKNLELILNITNANSVLTTHAPVTEGDTRSINVGLWHDDSGPGQSYTLTKIELADDADVAAPDKITTLSARAVSVSTEAGNSAVELAWTPPVDRGSNGGNGTGIATYYIYRDGALYDSVNKEWQTRWGNNPKYYDLDTEPGRTYSYEITALDSAVTGMHPTHRWWINTMDKRYGNESLRSNAAVITLPSWNSALILNPYPDLVYQGAFVPPNVDGWSYGLDGLTFYPSGNPGKLSGELSGSLYGTGHTGFLNIGEM